MDDAPGGDYAAQAAALPAVVRSRRLARFVVPVAVLLGVLLTVVLVAVLRVSVPWPALIIIPLPFIASGLSGYFRWRADRTETDYIALATERAANDEG